MKTLLILWTLLLAAALPAAAQQPLYIVNGKVCDDIRSIPPDDIEQVESCRPTRRRSPATVPGPRTA